MPNWHLYNHVPLHAYPSLNENESMLFLTNNYNLEKDVELPQETRRRSLINPLALKGKSADPVLKQDHHKRLLPNKKLHKTHQARSLL